MITLKQYKNYLIQKYDSEIDNIPDKRIERKQRLENEYSDETLKSIINESYSFARSVLNYDTIDDDYCKIPVEKNTTTYISLGLTDAHHSDTLFVDPEGRTISKYVLRQIFGDYFYIDLIDEEQEYVDGENIRFDTKYYIYMQNFPENIEYYRREINREFQREKDIKRLVLKNMYR